MDSLQHQVFTLQGEIDDLQQAVLDENVIISGELIGDYIRNTPELGQAPRFSGRIAVGKLQDTLFPTVSQNIDENAEGVAENYAKLSTPKLNIHHIKQLRNYRVAVYVTSRDEVHKLFICSKVHKGKLYVKLTLSMNK